MQIDTQRYGLDNYVWTVVGWSLSPDWSVVSMLREENPETYEDPTPTVPVTPPTIDPGEPVEPWSQTSQRILSSYVTDSDPADGLLQATDTQITVEAHSRRYTDRTVSVSGGTITTEDDGVTAIADSTLYHVYYDQSERDGGAVTYKATQSGSIAAVSTAQPFPAFRRLDHYRCGRRDRNNVTRFLARRLGSRRLLRCR